jgi:hypothetical protein
VRRGRRRRLCGQWQGLLLGRRQAAGGEGGTEGGGEGGVNGGAEDGDEGAGGEGGGTGGGEGGDHGGGKGGQTTVWPPSRTPSLALQETPARPMPPTSAELLKVAEVAHRQLE